MTHRLSRKIPEPIAQLRQELEPFRGTNPARTRLPEPFWESAVNLARQYGIWQTAKPLHLEYMGLGKAALRREIDVVLVWGWTVGAGPMTLPLRSNRPRAGSISGPYFGCRSRPCCTTVSCGRWNGPKTASRSVRLRIDGPNRAKQR